MSLLIANENLSFSAYHSHASAQKVLFFVRFFVVVVFLFFIYSTLERTLAQKAKYKYLQCSSNIEKITTFDT